MPNTHRRRDETVELRRVGGVNTPVGSRDPVYMYSVSQKNPSTEDLWQFFQSGWEFFNQILPAYYGFLSTLHYECLFNYLQL